MDFTDIIYQKQNAIATITLNRPAEMNALAISMVEEIAMALIDAQSDNDIRVLVITGNGPAFCAGGDLKEALNDIETGSKPESESYFETCGSMFKNLENFTKPVIAALNGITCAGGLEIAMAADLIVAKEGAKVGDSHANFGMFPGAGGAVRLSRLLPVNVAKYLQFSGDLVPAIDLKHFGLIHEVFTEDKFEQDVNKLAAKIATKSPLVMSKFKQVVKDGLNMPEDAALRMEMVVLKHHLNSYDCQEGLKAFAEKRIPEFKGH